MVEHLCRFRHPAQKQPNLLVGGFGTVATNTLLSSMCRTVAVEDFLVEDTHDERKRDQDKLAIHRKNSHSMTVSSIVPRRSHHSKPNQNGGRRDALGCLVLLCLALLYWDADHRASRSLADISNFSNMGGLYARVDVDHPEPIEEEAAETSLRSTQEKYPEFLSSPARDTSTVKPSTSTMNLLPTNNNASQVCLTTDCLQTKGQQLARAFPPKPQQDWCLPEKSSRPNREGLLLVKVPKAASSTAAGVALRIARRHHCQALQWQHKPGRTYARRNKVRSLLLTSIRDPASRVLSYLFFMEISIQQHPYSEAWILDRLRNFTGRYGGIATGQGGFSLQFAALEEIPEHSAWSVENRTRVVNPQVVEARVSRMMEGYDFMLVVDRMDESLVALALLLDIDMGDVLVTSSKVAGSYFYDPPRNQCVALSSSIRSDAVKAYLQSDDWKAQNYGDYLLHAAANRSLDLTIESLGKERFDTAMTRYQMLKTAEQQHCAPTVQFPCSKHGKPQPRLARQDCYARDFGCGYRCIDTMIADLDRASTIMDVEES